MLNNSKSEKKHESDRRLIDMLLEERGNKIFDTESLITETQKRVWSSLKEGYEYSPMVDESDSYLRARVFSRIDMIVMYVDIVGSTAMTLEMPVDKLAIIISSFAQELAYVVKQYGGFVLKFIGDAVLAYFIAEKNALLASDNAVNCARSMITVIKRGINPILNQYDYPELMVKIGLDFGKNIVVRYGGDPQKSHVDLMGPAMNMASKIQSLAPPNHIMVGDDVYIRLHPSLQRRFTEVAKKNKAWRYKSRISGNLYKVYQYDE